MSTRKIYNKNVAVNTIDPKELDRRDDHIRARFERYKVLLARDPVVNVDVIFIQYNGQLSPRDTDDATDGIIHWEGKNRLGFHVSLSPSFVNRPRFHDAEHGKSTRVSSDESTDLTGHTANTTNASSMVRSLRIRSIMSKGVSESIPAQLHGQALLEDGNVISKCLQSDEVPSYDARVRQTRRRSRGLSLPKSTDITDDVNAVEHAKYISDVQLAANGSTTTNALCICGTLPLTVLTVKPGSVAGSSKNNPIRMDYQPTSHLTHRTEESGDQDVCINSPTPAKDWNSSTEILKLVPYAAERDLETLRPHPKMRPVTTMVTCGRLCRRPGHNRKKCPDVTGIAPIPLSINRPLGRCSKCNSEGHNRRTCGRMGERQFIIFEANANQPTPTLLAMRGEKKHERVSV
ncbi:hypothetical protein B0H11DRAFT_1917537 [Mycena galericulata]|nr:hypothetical protein B0H11DRAFT_1917537 [Mycena galericulata]